MTVTAPTTATTSLYATTPTRTPKQSLDSEAFMNLLVTQLKSQDPGSPMDTNAMMTQTTQLASMEQLTALNSTITESFSLQMRMAASGLVGKQVSYTDSSGVAQTGIASSVSFAGSVPTVTIGSSTIALDAISGVASVA